MKKWIYILFESIVITVAIVVVFGQLSQQAVAPSSTDASVASSPSNATYSIDGSAVTLINGKAAEAIPDSSAQKVTTLFEANTKGDLHGDGIEDAVVILTQNSGGSGTFYYVAEALKTDVGYQGTNAILLGDRIAPVSNEIRHGFVLVNYADREKGQPMTARPSLGVTRYVHLEGTKLVEISTSNNLISVTAPTPGMALTTPLTVTGQARGTWYFEASFPVQVLDKDGKILAQGSARAQGDWMTDNFVPFKAMLTVSSTPGESGTVVFKKDNPSGLPRNDASISIPIVFQ